MLIDYCRYGILAAGVCCAVYQDVRYLKIKNWLNLGILLLGGILGIIGGLERLFDSLQGFLIPFVIGILFYSLRIFGAGDVKFMMALGALMGKSWMIDCMIYSVISGGVLALLLMLYRRILLERLCYMWNYIQTSFLLRKITRYQILDNQQKQFFPFAVAIACGSILACIL